MRRWARTAWSKRSSFRAGPPSNLTGPLAMSATSWAKSLSTATGLCISTAAPAGGTAPSHPVPVPSPSERREVAMIEAKKRALRGRVGVAPARIGRLGGRPDVFL